jgi:hypothetical protein
MSGNISCPPLRPSVTVEAELPIGTVSCNMHNKRRPEGQEANLQKCSLSGEVKKNTFVTK